MKSILLLTLTALLLATGPGSLPAAVPSYFGYQGQVKTNGASFTGLGLFKFAVIARPTGASLWSNDGSSVNGSAPVKAVSLGVTNSLFAVRLGDATIPNMQALAPEVFAAQANTALRVWFNDGVNGWRQLAPDTVLSAVPYAMSAPVPNGSITAQQLAPGAITPASLASASPPQAGRFLSYDASGRFIWSDPASLWTRHGTTAAYSAGSVGIGTTTPATLLDVRGHLTLETGNHPAIFTGTGESEWGRYLLLLNSPSYSSASGIKAGGALIADDFSYANPAKNDLVVKGKVGIGAPAGASPLQVHWDSWNSTTVPNISMTGENPALQWSSTPGLGGHEYRWLALHGLSGGLEFWHRSIDASTLPTRDSGWVNKAKLLPDGSLYLAGNASVRTLTIRGGADLAEPFPLSSPHVAKGSVVVVDPANPGHLKLSDQAYDKRVAGIVSGANGINPGIALHQEGVLDQGEQVALAGRVYVQADATSGPIEPGDLLTTSDTPGHAMRASDSSRAPGAILGKAMTGLAHGQGMVLVLVTLQ